MVRNAEIIFRLDLAQEGNCGLWPDQVDTHQQREQAADQYGRKGQKKYCLPMTLWSRLNTRSHDDFLQARVGDRDC